MIVSYQPKVIAKPHIKYVLSYDGEASVRVRVGDTVTPSTVVFEGNESTILESLNLCKELGVKPADVSKFVLKSDGEIIDSGETVARRSVAAGTIERMVKAQSPGRVSFSRLNTGIVDIRSPYAESSMVAGVHGQIMQIFPEREYHRDVVIEVTGLISVPFLMSGSDASGKLHMIKDGQSIYRPSDVDGSECSGKIVVAGRSLSVSLYDALVSAGACGIIAGGMQKSEFLALSDPAVPLAITEGWGIVPVNSVLMSVLTEHTGDAVYLDSKQQQIVLCPSDIVPDVSGRGFVTESGVSVCELKRGQRVQVWDMPYWGYCGSVTSVLEDERVAQVSIHGEHTILVNADSLVAIGEE